MSGPRLALAFAALFVVACGSPKKSKGKAWPVDKQTADALNAEPERKAPIRWDRPVPKMPPAFAAFPKPELASLDGMWVVASEIPRRKELWIVEAELGKLTIVDHRGRERIHGVGLLSPCSLQLTDEAGHGSTRQLGVAGDRIYIAHRGAIGVAAEDGGVLACVGSRVAQHDAEGECLVHSEMLGVWERRPATAEECALEDGALRFGKLELRAVEGAEGLWMDEEAQASEATRVSDRKAGEAAIQAEPEPTETGEPAATETGEPAATETGDKG